MQTILTPLARRIMPDFDQQTAADRRRLLMNLSGVLFFLPWALVGVIWLVRLIDWDVLRAHWGMMALILAASLALDRLPYFMVTNLGGENASYNTGNLSEILLVSGYFIFGPTAVLVLLADALVAYAFNWSSKSSRINHWIWLRNLVFSLSVPTISILTGLTVYTTGGGEFPLFGYSSTELRSALWAVLVYWSIIACLMLAWWALVYYSRLMEGSGEDGLNGAARSRQDQLRLYRQSFYFFMVSYLPGAFGIFAADLYTRIGLDFYVFVLVAVFVTNLLARRMSLAMMVAQQKTRELNQLEQLGRAIIAAPADASTLGEILAKFLPGMLSYQQLEVRLFDGRTLLSLPADRPEMEPGLWRYLKQNPTSQEFAPDSTLPWSQSPAPDRYLLAPILSTDAQEPIGGICLVQEKNLFISITEDVSPALQIIADQIASELHAAEVYEQTLEYQKVSQELAFAGEIQASFLPESLPIIAGWDIAGWLTPARETSGDFYDLIPLPGERLGFVVADVTDKGMGAALFMALSRTLMRTYALEYPGEPARVMKATNSRLLMDVQAGLFVTAFYAVLDPATGELVYANAGHPPPYCSQPAAGGRIERLSKTGMALGVMEAETWEQQSIQIAPGGCLVLYTDGVTEAQDAQGDFYGDERLRQVVSAQCGDSASLLLEAITFDIQAFVGEHSQADDLTLLVFRRE